MSSNLINLEDKAAKTYDPTRSYNGVPQYLKYNTASNIYECNPDYLDLISAKVSGKLVEGNLSPMLLAEVNDVTIKFGEYVADPATAPAELLPLFKCIEAY